MSAPAAILRGCAVATAVAFAMLGVAAADPAVAQWEQGTFELVNGAPTWVWMVVWAPMQAGSLAAAPVTAAVAAVGGRRHLGAQLLAAGPTAWLLARIAKVVVGRPRPVVLVADVVVRGGEVGGLGYPSGHVTVATALAVVAAGHLPRRWRSAPWAVLAAVALGRVVAGAHLPLDVLGGVLLGLLVGGATRAVGTRLTRADQPPRPGG